MIGQTISHYKILAKLGEGGMGVVYKAEDTKLKRVVALKFLPSSFMASEAEKTRFIHEAQAAAALNHPNICTIHEIDEADGQQFIAMEFVERQSLKAKIEAGPLKLDEALGIAMQVAEGLQAAHEKKITHRDIKPANVMITTKAQVKIMDFGLAKLAGRTVITKEGTTLGTVAYMSPEQARGEKVDHRTDIWSFGVVLYEMITGQLPFKGEYDQAVMYSIMNEEPEPVTGLRTGVPMELKRIVSKCLEKAPEERYQSSTEIQVDLKKLRRGLESAQRRSISPSVASPDAQKGHRRRHVYYLAAAIAGSLAVILAIVAYINLRPKDIVPRLSNPKQVTSAQGFEDYPTWSPAGDRLAYQSDQSGNFDIWVSQIGGGPPVNLTADHLGTDRWPQWSPDGLQIAFYSERDGAGLYMMPALGGVPRKVLSGLSGGSPQWSQDGTKLAYIPRDTSSFVEITTLSSGSSRRLPLPGTQKERFDLSWSPDEQAFAYRDAFADFATHVELWVLRLADGEGVPVTDRASNVRSPSWSPDGRFLYYVSDRAGSMDLWQQRMRPDFTPEGPPRAITTGIGMWSAVFSPDGKKLAYSKGRLVGNLWSVPIPDQAEPEATWADARQITFDHALVSYVDVSPDGQRLLFSSDRGGNADVWMMTLADGSLQQLTTDPALDFQPMWSPDGKQIAFHSARSGNRDIWVMPASGGPARQLTRHDASDMWPVWSPDGQEIAFASMRGGNFDIWVIQSTGGEARQLTSHPASDQWPQWSPDGKWLVFASEREAEFFRLWRMPAEGGQPELLTEARAGRTLWSKSGTRIYFVKSTEGTLTLWELSIETGRERQVMDLTGRPGRFGGDALASDGKQLFFAWQEWLGDIWVMDVEKEK
ncbi:serine/threonine-protein kinase [candidate division KSB1 bacterium]|nr:serine/threonine-protein kinase [candidate division KSB1 bacterium]